MSYGRSSGVRRHATLLVSVGLVLLLGLIGVVAGQRASTTARDLHREDRLLLQKTLSELTNGAQLVMASQLQSALNGLGAWDPSQGDAAISSRLEGLLASTRPFDAGAALVDATGVPLGTHAVRGALPGVEDPGWEPLRAAVLRGDGSLPLSGVLLSGSEPQLALGLPVSLVDGSQALVIALWTVRGSELQKYVAQLAYGQSYQGFVVDGAGTVLATTHPETLGTPVPSTTVRVAVAERRPAAVVSASEGGEDRVVVYAPVGATGWTGLSTQTASEFEGALLRSTRLGQGALVALLLIAGAALVTMHRKREAALRVVALRDELTGLYNRRGWRDLAEQELDRARRSGTARVLLFVDLDGLKQVNDVLGHREGDRALVGAARVLTDASRSTDLVGRLGGDEFVLLLGEDGQADGARRRLLSALTAYNDRSDAAFELRLSVGAEVWFPEAACTLDELVRRADDEMYADKASRPYRSDGVVRGAMVQAPGSGAPAGDEGAPSAGVVRR